MGKKEEKERKGRKKKEKNGLAFGKFWWVSGCMGGTREGVDFIKGFAP